MRLWAVLPPPRVNSPIAFALTGGEVSNFKSNLRVMDVDGPAPKVLLADKGYDTDFIYQVMKKRGGNGTVPTKRSRLNEPPVHPHIYALRKMVDRGFNKLKNARRLAIQYD